MNEITVCAVGIAAVANPCFPLIGSHSDAVRVYPRIDGRIRASVVLSENYRVRRSILEVQILKSISANHISDNELVITAHDKRLDYSGSKEVRAIAKEGACRGYNLIRRC